METNICMAESLPCLPETIITLSIFQYKIKRFFSFFKKESILKNNVCKIKNSMETYFSYPAFLKSNILGVAMLSHFCRIRLSATPQMAAHQAPLSLGFSRQNTGVGCHFLLQCMKVKSKSEVAQSCPTPSDPMECSLPGSSVLVSNLNLIIILASMDQLL